jgi:hypothetical protein
MTLDQDTKQKVKDSFKDWVDGKERKAAISDEMKEAVEAAAQHLNIEKKKVSKMFRIMEKMSMNEEYDLIQLCEEVSK